MTVSDQAGAFGECSVGLSGGFGGGLVMQGECATLNDGFRQTRHLTHTKTTTNELTKAAAGCMHGQCRAAAVPGSPVELRGHKGYGNQRDCGSNNICLHFAEPRQCLQAGVTQEENHHQSNNQLVHVCLRYHLLFRWFYLGRPTTRYR